VAQLRFAIGGGGTLPTGTFDDVAGTGWHGMAAIGLQPADFPIGFQVDGMYSRFGVDAAENIDADWELIQGTADAVFKFKSSEESKFHPYLIGGVGGYHVKAVGNDAAGADGETDFGVNAGAGFDFSLGNLSAFLEARYHAVFSGTTDPETLEDATASFVPITIGIRFGKGS
jgi:hypothetical protein